MEKYLHSVRELKIEILGKIQIVDAEIVSFEAEIQSFEAKIKDLDGKKQNALIGIYQNALKDLNTKLKEFE